MDINALRAALDYDESTGIFRWKTARRNVSIGDAAGCTNRKGYQYIGFMGGLYRSNRLAWFYVHGIWPSGQVDHINGDRLDNRLSNLRDVSADDNQRNRRRGNRNSTSKLLGVSWHVGSSKWRAQISIGRTTKHIGMFDSEDAAYDAYMVAKAICHSS